MKIAACNMRHFVSGGPERYMFALKGMLEANGHDFVPFSVNYDRNEPTPYSKYFVSPPGNDPAHVYFKDLNMNMAQKLRFAANAVYSFEARNNLTQLLKDTQADLVYTLQIHTFLSYSVIDAAAAMGKPVVARMSNYQLLCPAELFLRDQQVCEACKDNLFNAVRYKCIQHSTFGSLIRAGGLKLHRMRKTFDKVSRFVVPSRFLREKMIEYGFEAEKIIHLPSFVDTRRIKPCYEHDNYIAYSGRLAVEKGLQSLIDGFVQLKTPVKLLLIGDYHNPEGERLRQYVAENGWENRIEFPGYLQFAELEKVLSRAMFTICPSQWYENTPMSIYESFAFGKPVVGADLGSIPEQIIAGRTGLLFEPRNPADIAEKLNYLISHPEHLAKMGKEAREIVEQKHSPEAHYQQLIRVYEDVL